MSWPSQRSSTESVSVARGTVTGFDEVAGRGEIALESGETICFHATAITDGSRLIQAGVEVAVELAATHGGRLEARRVLPPTAG